MNTKTLENGKIIFILICTVLLVQTSCSQLNYSKAYERNQNKFKDEGTTKEALFLVKVKSLDLLTREISDYAEKSAYAVIVKDFSKELKKDHQLLDIELEVLAKRKGIKLPDAMSKDHWYLYNKLRNAEKKDFDETFVKIVKKSHANLFEEFEYISVHAKDNSIRGFASKKLEMIRSHIENAENINQDLLES